MSNLTQCNFCSMEGFKALAKQHDAPIIIVAAPLYEQPNTEHAVEVYIHYKGDKEATWCAWLMQVPDKCMCPHPSRLKVSEK